jgi:hypothetical protein
MLRDIIMSCSVTPSKNQCPLTPDEQERMRVISYASSIGSIMYSILCTWPNVTYALSAMSMYQLDYSEAH